MAEHILRQRLGAARAADIASAGLSAWIGAPAELEAVTVMNELGIDISGHRGRQFVLEEARAYDLILVMEHAQQQWLNRRFPILRGRVKRLGEWLDADIADPLGQPLDAFRGSRDAIVAAIDTWEPRLTA
jgi:protein-tyrosine phosphatase